MKRNADNIEQTVTATKFRLANDIKCIYNKSENKMCEKENDLLKLSSSKSLITALEKIKQGKAGLNKHRQSLLSRVPKPNDWANFSKGSVTMKDIAFLTAKTGDEFAILAGKREDILFHGNKYHCLFDGAISEMLMKGQFELYGHSHPAEMFPRPSDDDIETLQKIGQKKSRLISAITGREIEYNNHRFGVIEEIEEVELVERSEFGNVDI